MPEESVSEHPEEWYRYSLALQASQEGFWDWDLVAGRIWGSNRWQALTGVGEPCSHPRTWLERIHPEDRPRFEADLRALRTGKTHAISSEHRILHRDGRWRWVLASGIAAPDISGQIRHVAGTLAETTERRTADALTGLPNRLFLIDYLERQLERARLRGRWDFAVLAVALDRFDQVNETLGSAGGDRLLMDTALRLQATLPDGSIVARLNGAEFLVCLDSAAAEADAVAAASRIAAIFREPFIWRGHRVTPQVAIGVALAEPACAHPEELMSDAESALNRARRLEPPGIVCYSSGMREEALRKLELEADLERAIREGGLTMYYQPEVDLKTRNIVGFEALARWNHKRRGMLPPSEFIPLAEETGLILPLGEWGLKEACRQLMKWRSTGNPVLEEACVSVNLSARQLEHVNLPEQVRQVLEETRLEPGRLRLEVTESSLIADAASAQKTMEALGELGVGLHMDDFGVGHSSLHYLRRFPFDTLKIDKSFVKGIVSDGDSRQIVRSILDMARSFGMNVVAEGIEDEEQLEELKRLGCPCGQGYYFARPLDPLTIDQIVASGQWAASLPAMADA